jgi:hypothetical protein
LLRTLQQNKFIGNGLIKPVRHKVFFFLVLLISFSLRHLNAQTLSGDTLKNVKADTLSSADYSDELSSRVEYFAEDSIVGLPGTGKVYLYGKSRVVYEGVEMKAAVIEIDYARNIMSAYGQKDSTGKLIDNPVFTEGSQDPMGADRIMYNLKTGKGKIFNALTKQGELLVIGKEIKKDSTNVVYMKNMRCIPCQEADARTVFVASKAKVIPDDKIVTGPMYLEIGGVPTPLGLPFGFFPNTKKQHSGILMPAPGKSGAFGFFLQNGGFYWGINDQTDMVIQGDVYSNGTFAVRTTNNYKVLYKATGSLNLSYSKFNIGDPDIKSQYKQRAAYSVRWRHTQDNKLNPSVSFNADVNYQSNQNLSRLSAGSTEQFLQSQFISNIAFAKSFKNGLLSLTARQEQNTQTRMMTIVLPTLSYYLNAFYPFKNESHVKQTAIDKIKMSYRVEATNQITGKDSLILKGDWLDNLRYGLNQSIPISTNFNILKFITATPQLDLSSMMTTKTARKNYVEELISTKDGEHDSLVTSVKTNTVKEFAMGYDARFSTNFSTKVYFDYFFRKGNLTQIRHLMIPNITYSYRPDFGAEQYGFWKQVQLDSFANRGYYSIFENSVYGGPARGKTNSMGISLSNNVEAKLKQKTDTGTTFRKVKLLQDLNLNTSYNFAADSFKMQPINVSARTVVLKYFNVVATSLLDPYAYDHTHNRRMNEFAYDHGEGLVRWAQASLAVSTGFGSNMLQALQRAKEKPRLSSGVESGIQNDLNAGDKLAWNLNISYVLGLTNANDRRMQPIHTIQFSGDIQPTKYWKIGMSSGYNLEKQTLSRTQFNVTRDLKCWQAKIEWVPFGIGQHYSIGVNLKASMLSDINLKKQGIPKYTSVN